MAITANAIHALLIDGEDVAAERGGAPLDRPGAFYAPTVVTGAQQPSEIVQHPVRSGSTSTSPSARRCHTAG
jgi:hypothetical protein